MKEEILQPVDAYGELAQKHRELTEQYFDELVAQSGISAEENAATVSEWKNEVAKFQAANAIVCKNKGLRVLFALLACVMVVAGVITLVALLDTNEQWIGITAVCLGVAAFAALITVVCVVFNKKIKLGGDVASKHKKAADELEIKAWKQMAPLNAKYDWNIPDGLIYRTVPQIQLDKYFDEEKLSYFAKHCSLGDYDENSSAVWLKSGNSNGRPFLYTRFLRQSMQPHTYTGTRVVTWTEWQRDSEGHRHSVTCSETLVATVVKPEPVYRNVTYLFYGCNAAADLHFSRRPTVPHNADDKKIDALVRKGEKELEKKAREAVTEGGAYNKLANSEFEVLFGADNRDNEVQFRMMFTPLAQQNMVKLLRLKEPYGDDFYFQKNGVVNVISSEHSSRLRVDADPTLFAHFDLEQAKKNFVEFNGNYFSALYFDFAPLFSVPLYSQDQNDCEFGVCQNIGNIGCWEAETVANAFDSELLAHPSTATRVILKAVTETGENGTLAHVTAHSFEAVPQTDFVPVPCRNGRVYEVAVPWVQYLPLVQNTDIVMQAVQTTREQFNADNRDNWLYVAGIRAKLTKN